MFGRKSWCSLGSYPSTPHILTTGNRYTTPYLAGSHRAQGDPVLIHHRPAVQSPSYLTSPRLAPCLHTTRPAGRPSYDALTDTTPPAQRPDFSRLPPSLVWFAMMQANATPADTSSPATHTPYLPYVGGSPFPSAGIAFDPDACHTCPPAVARQEQHHRAFALQCPACPRRATNLLDCTARLWPPTQRSRNTTGRLCGTW